MAEEIYIGTKVVAAEPMDEVKWAFLKGYVPQENRPGYKVRYEDGYVSWSPKDVFEQFYRPVTQREATMIFDKRFLEPAKAAQPNTHIVRVYRSGEQPTDQVKED